MNDSHLQQYLDQHPDRRLPLAALGVFRGPVTLATLAGLSAAPEAPPGLRGRTEQDWTGCLERGAEAGVLLRTPEGYEVPAALAGPLDSLRCGVFSNSLPGLDTAFIAACTNRARRLVTGLADRPRETLALLRLEEPNLLHALRLARAQSRWSEANDLLSALAKLHAVQPGPDWETTLGETEAVLKPARDRHRAASLVETLMRLRADLAERRGDAAGVLQENLRLLDLFEKRGDEAGLAATLERLGELALAAQEFDKADAWYRRSLYLRCRLADTGAQSDLLRRLGSLAQRQGRLDQAAAWLNQGLALAERVKDEREQSRILLQCGEVARDRKKPERAEKYFLRCLELRERLGQVTGQAEVQEQLGLLSLQRGAHDEAEHWFRCQRETCKSLGLERQEAQALTHLAHVAVRQRRLADAEDYYRRSLQIGTRLGDERSQASSLCGLGAVAYERGQLAQAEQWFEQSLVLAERTDDASLQTRLLCNLANAAFCRKELARAEQSYGLALRIAERLNHEAEQASLLYSLGRVAEEQKDFRHAADRYERSGAIAARLGDLAGRVRTLRHLAELAFKEQRFEEAEKIHQQSLQVSIDAHDVREQAEICHRLARVAEARRAFKEAGHRFEQCLALREQAGDLAGVVRTLDHYRALPEAIIERVARWYTRTLAQAERLGNTHLQCVVLHKLGDLAERQQRWVEAEQWYRKCLAMEETLGRKSDQSLLLLKLGLVTAEQRRLDEAEKLYHLSVELGVMSSAERWLPATALVRLGHLTCQRASYEDALLWYQLCLRTTKDPSVLAEAMTGLGRVAQAHGDFGQAENWLNQSLEASRHAGADRPAALAWSQMGLLEQQRKEFKKASAHLLKALHHFEKTGDAGAQGEMHLHLGSLNEAQGRPDKARESYEQAASLFQQCNETHPLELARRALERVARLPVPGDAP